MIDQTRAILTRCQSILLRFCQTQANTYIAASGEYLFTQAEQASGNEAQRRLFEARQAILDQQENLPRQLDRSLTTLFESFTAAAGRSKAEPTQATFSAADSNDELSLVEDDDMELKVAVTSMSHRAEADYAEALYALGQRMAILNNGVKLRPESSPFSPSIFCQALTALIENLQLDIRTRLILLKLFDRYFLKNLSTVYDEINQYLVSENILPNLRYKKELKRPIAPKRRATDNAARAEELSVSENRQAELFDVIRSILDANKLPINPQLPVVPVDKLIADLSAFQTQQLSHLHDTAITAAPRPELPDSNTHSHQQAIECVGILFDYILNDNFLPDSVKSLLSHLHTPLLKLALLDQSFLSDPKHDGRVLLNNLIGAGERWVAPDAAIKNSVFPQMQNVIKRVIREFNHENENSTEVFGTVAKEFNQYIERVARKATIAEERSVQAAKGKETLEMGRAQVKLLIQEKLQEDLLPKPIVQLISGPWAAFLSYTLLRHGEDSVDWTNAVSIIDSILWFIGPKLNAEEMKQAKALREDIVNALDHGLTSVGLDPREIAQHLHALDMCSKLATENANPTAEPPVDNSACHANAIDTCSADTSSTDTSSTDTGSTTTTAATANTEPAHSAQRRVEKTAGHETGYTTENNTKNNTESLAENTTENTQTEVKTASTKKRPPNVTDQHLSMRQSQQDDFDEDFESTDSAELVKLSDIMPSSDSKANGRRASAKAIKQVLSLEFGTWLDWNKPGEPERQLKLTWYNQNTQNCMLSNQMGQQVSVTSANDIALGMAAGWIKVSDTTAKKPFFERMLETVVDQLKLKNRSA